jgi:hypothetical protein
LCLQGFWRTVTKGTAIKTVEHLGFTLRGYSNPQADLTPPGAFLEDIFRKMDKRISMDGITNQQH